MSIRVLVWGAVLCIGMGLPRAAAQGYASDRGGRFNRAQSPSGSLGGRFTGGATAALSVSRSASVSLMGQQDYSFRRSGAQTRYGSALSLTGTGLRGSFGGLQALPPLGGRMQAQTLSGMGAALRLDLLVPGVPTRGYLPTLDAYKYTPRAPTTHFHDVFGLVPAREVHAVAEVATMAELMEGRTQLRVERARSEGMEFFRAATREAPDPRSGVRSDCPDCRDKLARAIQRLTIVEELDRESDLPSVLIAHARLDQERPMTAFGSLLRAFGRNSELFSSNRDALGAYFGDVEGDGEDARSAYLEGQMRRYLGIGSGPAAGIGAMNPTSPEAWALEAYCAWRFGDPARAREALEEVRPLAGRLSPEHAAQLMGMVAALEVQVR